ncbi:MAG TPA: Mth938-like domain-containing protein [Povalibacter sp.]|uniref:Mth938-like domain-containing protein n=1 Tax=Povalibacter sp. TaxID=1962978 RepID=UPI002CF1605C|nr:Mth938-like domain-containing protein [Povalibacter sp.]HMN44847.1 Mth938-like domain-containing protein [Povalibacter sp.]
MKLTDDSVGGIQLVRAYSPGEIRVNETIVHRSCLLRADTLITDWRPQSLNELTAEDLEPLFALEPEIVVLGSGTRQKFPPSTLLARILSRGIGCEVMDTGAACRTYNVLVSEDRKVVAALFLQD